MKILIVEDEPSLRELIQRSLEKERYVVEAAGDFNSALRKIEDYDYDCILLDIMLPDGSGLDLLERLKALHKRENVIIISAKDSLEDKVLGLELGADDYLVKPFEFPELLARIRTLLRRSEQIPVPEVLRVANLELDPARHRAFRGEQRIDLTTKEFALLHLLMRRSGEVLSRTQIISLVWDMNFDCDTNVVEVSIRRLRAKIDDPFDNKLIHTLRGVGYVLEERA